MQINKKRLQNRPRTIKYDNNYCYTNFTLNENHRGKQFLQYNKKLTQYKE